MIFIVQVLVDVPCTSDRHALITAFNIFSKKRIQERVELPVYQQKLLESVFRDFNQFNFFFFNLDQLFEHVNQVVLLFIPHVPQHLFKMKVLLNVLLKILLHHHHQIKNNVDIKKMFQLNVKLFLHNPQKNIMPIFLNFMPKHVMVVLFCRIFQIILDRYIFVKFEELVKKIK